MRQNQPTRALRGDLGLRLALLVCLAVLAAPARSMEQRAPILAAGPIGASGTYVAAAIAGSDGGDLLVAGSTVGGISKCGDNTGAFVLLLNEKGETQWCRVFGSSSDAARALALGPDGSIYVAGMALSGAIPVSATAAQPKPAGYYDGFILHVSASGDRIISGTYLGTAGFDSIDALCTAPDGTVIVAGETSSLVFPGVAQAGSGGTPDRNAFVTAVSSDLSRILYTVLLHGPNTAAFGVTAGPSGIYVVGSTSSAVLFSDTPSFPPCAAQQCTYGFLAAIGAGAALTTVRPLAGGPVSALRAVAVYSGSVWVVGDVSSGRCPECPTPFWASLSPSGTGAINPASAGSKWEGILDAICVSKKGGVTLAGQAAAPGSPVSRTALQPMLHGPKDALMIRVGSDGAVQYSTYWGGAGTDTAASVVCTAAGTWLVGDSDSGDLPQTYGWGQPGFPPGNVGFALLTSR